MFGPNSGPNAKRGNLSKETETFLAGTRPPRPTPHALRQPAAFINETSVDVLFRLSPSGSADGASAAATRQRRRRHSRARSLYHIRASVVYRSAYQTHEFPLAPRRVLDLVCSPLG